MCNNFEENLYPDNRHRYLGIEKDYIIYRGGTSRHIFILPKIYLDQINKIYIIYKQGFNFLFEIELSPDVLEINELNNYIKLPVELDTSQTLIFNDTTLLDTFAQIKLITSNDEIVYEDFRKIAVLKPLDIVN